MRVGHTDPGATEPLESSRTLPENRHSGARIGSLAIVLVIALQVAVPTIALLLPPPQRFGFQMYSGLGGVGVTVIDDEGVETAFEDASQLVGELRPEIDWLPTLPEAVCDAVPEAARVQVQQSERKRTAECD